jgi:triphosphoribosyl-dephospho-CoA synthetase
MKHDCLIEFLAQKVQEVLRDNLTSQVSDEIAFKTIRSLIGTPIARVALKRGSDTARAFLVRAVKRVVTDESLPARETLNRLPA